MMGKFLKRILVAFLLFFSIGSIPTAHAYTDDARVLGGLNSSTDVYTYLNQYPYSLWKSNHGYPQNDIYISKDQCVLVNVWNNYLAEVFLVGPGYKTDKGIEVGMTVQDIVNAYGPLYDADEVTLDDRDKIEGVFHGSLSTKWVAGLYHRYPNGSYYKPLRQYYYAEYVSPHNEGIDFLIDKKTNKIAIIMYSHDRHGNSPIGPYVIDYGLLDFVKK